jgi:uncharacterized protein (TIGR02145 family)
MNYSVRIPVIIIFLISLTLCLTSCKPKPALAVVTTTNVTGITQTSATTGGNVTDDGNAEVTARGVCWGTSQNPTTGSGKTSDGTGTGNFTSSITGLTPGIAYYVRAYATNSEGTSYGNEVTFSSNPVLLATLTTTTASSVTQTTAVSGGNITLDGGGAITGRGLCWSTSQNPTTALITKTSDGAGTGTFTSNISGLTANTKYYLRAYAVNSAGTAYGDEKFFTTEPIKTVTDIDGNVYNTVTIGTQVWMAENLKVTKYRNGDAIPNITDNTQWYNLTTGAYSNYENNTTNGNTYGRLYNWHTVGTGYLCPTGWHVPTSEDWISFRDYLMLNGYNFDGSSGGNNIGKSIASTTGWEFSPITGAVGNTDYPEKRNVTGFTALPGGLRHQIGMFANIKEATSWWLATENSSYSSLAWVAFMWYEHSSVIDATDEHKNVGQSVRCLKD